MFPSIKRCAGRLGKRIRLKVGDSGNFWEVTRPDFLPRTGRRFDPKYSWPVQDAGSIRMAVIPLNRSTHDHRLFHLSKNTSLLSFALRRRRSNAQRADSGAVYHEGTKDTKLASGVSMAGARSFRFRLRFIRKMDCDKALKLEDGERGSGRGKREIDRACSLRSSLCISAPPCLSASVVQSFYRSVVLRFHASHSTRKPSTAGRPPNVGRIFVPFVPSW